MTALTVISSGLRSPSSTHLLAERLAEAASEALASEVTTTWVEVRDHAHAVTDALIAGYPAPELGEALAAVQRADALIVVTPTFQSSFAGLFKSFVDLLEPHALIHKPVLLAATGGSERHSMVIEYALRPLFSYLGATTVPTGIYAATSDFGDDALGLERRVRRATTELALLTTLACTQGSGQASASEPLDQARQALTSAVGQQVGDFGDLLRSLGQV